MLVTMPFLSNTQIFIEKYSYITWHIVKYVFTTTNYKADLEDRHVYINVLKSGFHKVWCMFPISPYEDIIKWILPHIDTKKMTLISVSGWRLTSYMAHDFHLMYHFPFPKAYIYSHFYAITSCLRTKDVIKIWMKEPSKFHQTPNHTYRIIPLERCSSTWFFLMLVTTLG